MNTEYYINTNQFKAFYDESTWKNSSEFAEEYAGLHWNQGIVLKTNSSTDLYQWDLF